MFADVITNPEQVTVAWLTHVLTNNGALIRGSVSAFQIVKGRGNWSDNAIFKLAYENGSQGDLPQRLFLKMVDTGASGADEFFGQSEVAYYLNDYAGLENAPLIRCYDGAFSEELQSYHLLLDDLSPTHMEAAEKSPTAAYGLALADGLAAMHAWWWGADRLAEANAPIHSAEHIRRFVGIAEPGVEHILDQFAGDLKAHWPESMQNLFAQHPQAMIKRTEEDNGFTLIHGDVGHNNILVPLKGDRPIYIIDRQPFNWSLTTWLGVYDLAYAMVLDWEVETRRSLEIQVLRRYYDQLLKNGVQGYSWGQLFDDYRLSVGMCLYIAVEYCRGGISESLIASWLPMLRRTLTACDDLRCSELW